MSNLEDLLAFQLSAVGIKYQREYRAVPGRRYRWDFFVYPDLLIEVQGGVWMQKKTGHTHGSGVWRDTEKQSLAAVLGYHTMAFVPNDIRSGLALQMIEAYLERAAAQSVDDSQASGAAPQK